MFYFARILLTFELDTACSVTAKIVYQIHFLIERNFNENFTFAFKRSKSRAFSNDTNDEKIEIGLHKRYESDVG